MKAFNSIETNTKVRRLGYFIQIVNEIGTNSMAEGAIIKRLTRWSNNNLDLLNKHIDSTGVIKESLKGMSAHRYLSCATRMELIAKIGHEYRLTKHGKILLLFNQRDHSHFLLKLQETCFFLNRLFLLDSDYLILILQFIKEHPSCTLSLVQKEFRDTVLSWLRIKAKYIFANELYKKREIFAVENRIKNWTKPEKYAEHIVPPRLQWLLDLCLIDWECYRNTHKFTLSKSGKIFLSNFPKCHNYVYVDCNWMNNDYFEYFIRAFLPKFKITHFSQLGHKRQYEIIFHFLEEGFKLFRTTELMRIPVSQFLYFTCINLAVLNKISCKFQELKKCLNEISTDSKGEYYFYWSAQQNDGHITKRQK